MLSLYKLNKLMILAILWVTIIILLVAVFLLAYRVPGITGSPSNDYEIEEVYRFEPWSFHLNSIHINFPKGGLIAHAYNGEQVEGALFWGSATYHSPQYSIPDEAGGFFVLIDEQTLESQKGAVIFSPVTETSEGRKMENLFKQNPGLPELEGAGVPLNFPPLNDSFYLYFLDSHENVISPFIYEGDSKSPWLSGIFYFLIFLIFLLITQLLSLGFDPVDYRKEYPKPTYVEIAGLLIVLVATFAAHYWSNLPGTSIYEGATAYGLILALVYLLSRHGGVLAPHWGISAKTWKNGYFLALIISFFFLLLPWEPAGIIRETPWIEVIQHFAMVFFLTALLHELVWRGYIQVTLSRLCGRHAGLLLTALGTGLAHYLFFYLGIPEKLSYPFIMVDVVILVPGTSLILGYLFQRTENIFSCALLHTLIVFLPEYLAY